MNWFCKCITTFPGIIISVIGLFSIFITYISLKDRKLPSFEDPQLGFETRGTEISQRLIAWDKLMKESKSGGTLVINPNEIIIYSKSIPSRSLSKRVVSEQTDTAIILHKPIIENEDDERNKHNEKINSVWKQIKQKQFPERKEDSPMDEELKRIYRLTYDENFFCDTIQFGYSQIIFSAKPDQNLFSYNAIKDLCTFQWTLELMPNYMRSCITSDNGYCCNIWSLPNYVARLQRLSNCRDIKEKDTNSTSYFLEICYKFYLEGKLLSKYNGENIPRICKQNQDIYNVFQYIVDEDFIPTNSKESYVKDTSMYLPIIKSSLSLQLFHDIEDLNFYSKYFTISAMDLGVKYSLFDEYLIHDIRYILLSSIFVIFCVWIYTGCIFITILTITAIFFSLIMAYFIYTVIFGLQFFPFMNILAVIVSLGIGSDDAYIICKVWDRTKKEHSHLPKLELVELVIKHSAIAVFVTTLTTVAAFLSSYWSSVTAVRCFSIYAGLSVLINFIFMITWILSGIVISSEWPYIPFLHWNFSKNADVVYENILSVKSTFDHYIVICLEKYNLLLIIVLSSVSVISMFSVLFWPKLQVPDSSEFQLFQRKHLLEQYDLTYKERFRFSHAYSEENYNEKLPLRFVWGVLPIDSGNYLDPNSRGKLHFDASFDIAAAESQEWLLRFCSRLRMQPFNRITMGPALSNCFIETFKTWMSRKCTDPVDNTDLFPCCNDVAFPYPRRVFNVCIIKAMSSLYKVESFLSSEVAGPRFLKNSTRKIPKIKALVVEFTSNMSFTTSFEAMNKFYHQVETWTKEELKTAPPGMRNGWFITYLSFFDLQRTLTQDTTVSILISMSVALFVLLAVTVNLPLSLLAILSISCIIFVSVSILIILGWNLNILESIAISLAIGMSVDFSLHYAVNYKMCADKTNRKTCVIHSLSIMAAPSLMAAITTGASGIFMIPSIVLPYIQIGIFLIVVSLVSWIYATFFQMSLLYRYGPQNNYGQFSYPNVKIIFNRFRGRLFPPKSNENRKSFKSFFCPYKSNNPVYSIHELKNLSNQNKKNKSKHIRSESFSHMAAPISNLKPIKRVSNSLEQIPSGASSVTFVHEDDYERHIGNTYVEI